MKKTIGLILMALVCLSGMAAAVDFQKADVYTSSTSYCGDAKTVASIDQGDTGGFGSIQMANLNSFSAAGGDSTVKDSITQSTCGVLFPYQEANWGITNLAGDDATTKAGITQDEKGAIVGSQVAGACILTDAGDKAKLDADFKQTFKGGASMQVLGETTETDGFKSSTADIDRIQNSVNLCGGTQFIFGTDTANSFKKDATLDSSSTQKIKTGMFTSNGQIICLDESASSVLGDSSVKDKTKQDIKHVWNPLH